MPRPPLPSCLVLAGPTAAGKTAAAFAVAEAFARDGRAVEIVSVDSALVYRGMDVGTAKPTAAERASVPHHLIDILDPAEAYSAARFAADAARLAGEIAARGALPLLVGGTMLYLKALEGGLDAMPAADTAVRAELARRLARDGLPVLYDELKRVDPPTAARLAPGDSQRIQRALEVWRVSGRPLSAWQQATTSGTRPAGAVLPLAMISLEPADREALKRRIDRRFAAMLDAGLLDEVRALRARGDLTAELPSMRCVGYRQAWQALDAAEASGCAVDGAALAERGSAATRQLAKRQLTWLRGGWPGRHVVACDATDVTAQVVALARAFVDGCLAATPAAVAAAVEDRA